MLLFKPFYLQLKRLPANLLRIIAVGGDIVLLFFFVRELLYKHIDPPAFYVAVLGIGIVSLNASLILFGDEYYSKDTLIWLRRTAFVGNMIILFFIVIWGILGFALMGGGGDPNAPFNAALIVLPVFGGAGLVISANMALLAADE